MAYETLPDPTIPITDFDTALALLTLDVMDRTSRKADAALDKEERSIWIKTVDGEERTYRVLDSVILKLIATKSVEPDPLFPSFYDRVIP